MAPGGDAGVEFRSNGAFASNGWDDIGLCDDSGTWETADGVITLTFTAVSSAGTDCAEIGSEERYNYTVDATTFTATEQTDGTALVFTKM